MKMGLFFLYGILVFLITLVECFLLSGGIALEKDNLGFRRIALKGEFNPKDYVVSFALAIIAAFMAGLAPVSGVWGIIAFIIALAMMGYVCYWASTEASEIKEMVVFVGLMIVIFFIAKMGTIASGAVIRSLGFLKFWRALPGVALVASFAIMIASNLQYRSRGGNLLNPDGIEEQTRLRYRYAYYGVLVVAAVIVIVMLIKGIT